jgi:amino-acid N-acetyltransferase
MDLSELRVESATASDDLPVRGLLTAAGLPLEGLSDQFPSAYVVAHHRGVIVGVAGLEAYGQVGLLRSVAVADSMRSRGLGRRLVENRLARAREGGLKSVFLLTSTAPDYFERLGFSRADRAGAPAELSRAPEFAYACPASATCLVFRL